MTFLHYQLCEAGHDWVLACENRPVASFHSRTAAMNAARLHLAAAERRGDVATLETHDERAFPPERPRNRELALRAEAWR